MFTFFTTFRHAGCCSPAGYSTSKLTSCRHELETTLIRKTLAANHIITIPENVLKMLVLLQILRLREFHRFD